MGAKRRQGPHQAAQKSTKTIPLPPVTSPKSAWVRFLVAMHLSFGAPEWAWYASGLGGRGNAGHVVTNCSDRPPHNFTGIPAGSIPAKPAMLTGSSAGGT